jgi:hypothetical protein
VILELVVGLLALAMGLFSDSGEQFANAFTLAAVGILSHLVYASHLPYGKFYAWLIVPALIITGYMLFWLLIGAYFQKRTENDADPGDEDS